MKRRTVEFDGQRYKVRSSKVEIPDLAKMDRFEALRWLIAHTYARGYSTAPATSIAFGGAISIN